MSARIVLAGALASLLAVAAACSDDEPAAAAPPPSDVVDDGDGGGGAPYTGPAQGGLFPDLDGSPDFVPIDAGNGTAEASVECCQTTFKLADATNDETTAVLKGDFTPLDGAGVPLTYENGAWTATACIPVGEYIRYRFYFGQMHEDAENDAGALIDDNRYDPSKPTDPDGNGSYLNTIERQSGCAD